MSKERNEKPEEPEQSKFILFGPPGEPIQPGDEENARAIFAKGISEPVAGENGEMSQTITLSLKDALLLKLYTWEMAPDESNISAQIKKEAAAAYPILSQHLGNLKVTDFTAETVLSGENRITYSLINTEGKDEALLLREVGATLNTRIVLYALLDIYGEFNKYISHFPKTQTGRPKKERHKPGTLRVSGHYVDQVLPKSKNKTAPLFEELLPGTKQEIISSGQNVLDINRHGKNIVLDGAEQKLITALWELIYERSHNTTQPDKPDYYSGNGERVMIQFADGAIQASSLSATLYEITERYNGGKKVSGKDLETVRRLITDLEHNPEKKHLIQYEKVIKQGSKVIRRRIETFASILQSYNLTEEDISNDMETAKRKQVVVRLHPVLYDQIPKKYVERPSNLSAIAQEAYGNAKVPKSVWALIDYLSRIVSNKQTKHEIFIKTLYNTIAPEYYEQGRKALIKTYLEKAVDTCKKIGLVLEYKVEEGGRNPKACFTLNKNWAKQQV